MHSRILIAGTHSGCGKTTVTLALLSALKNRGIPLAAFKCGPDYIDPMFHRAVLGLPSHNLDPFFCGADGLCSLLSRHGEALSVIEGVMGYYDGVGPTGSYSTYEVAKKAATPVILVVNVAGLYQSAGAVLLGYSSFRSDSGIRGVIFNGASQSTYPAYRWAAEALGLLPLGFLPREAALEIESRHLGLFTANEVEGLSKKLLRLSELAEAHIDLAGVLALSREAPPLSAPPVLSAVPNRAVRIAVARDEAFCFLYEENLELLCALGAELCFFSPIRDARLPLGIQGLYLPGGYPELHLSALTHNTSMREDIKKAVESGLPTIAECGGFLYLHAHLDGLPMAGVIRADASRTARLQRFGYVTLTANRDNLLCSAGDSIRAHAFHYYESADCGDGFTADRPSGGSYPCAHGSASLYAGFPHLYFPSNPEFPKRFLERAFVYAAR